MGGYSQSVTPRLWDLALEGDKLRLREESAEDDGEESKGVAAMTHKEASAMLRMT